MRAFVICVFVMGCSDNSGAKADAGCAVLSAPARCVAGGLVGVDLAGVWTLTGTMTNNGCNTGTPTMTPVSMQITLTVAGCVLNTNGMIDDTVALESSTVGTSSSNLSICMDATGLSYESRSQSRCIPTNPNPQIITVTGTLTR